ncbi:MAG: polyphosphate:AMP phosphotransferase [Methylococcaceae bacterium]
MFESGEKKQKISKQDYDAELDLILEQLLDLQQQLDDTRTAALVILAGVDGSGKGDMLTKLNEWFDPRYMRTHAYSDASEDERKRPRHWRYWMNMPVSGHLGLDVFGWYGQLFSDCLRGVMNTEQAEAELAHINRLEKTLTDNGILVIKIWLHLTRTQQIKKINKLAEQRDSTAKLTDSEKQHLKRYPEFIALAERVLRATHTESADWLVLNGYDANYRRLTIARHLTSRLTSALQRQHTDGDERAKPALIAEPLYSRLSTIDLSQTLDKKRYQNLLVHHQNRLGELTNQARHEGVGTMLVFEGWDASGKGGAIRRLTAALDARNYTVIPIAAPSSEEKAHHYLWRFWKHVPRDGQITVYDRSWYGRVLVERVEGLASTMAWMRAYSEINEFERELAEHGILVIKFWLHISKEEQLRRFAIRENTRYKRYKITAEDYRNRARWDVYEQAVDEMLIRTDTPYAPWYVIPSENKYDARIRIFEHLEAAYQSRLAYRSVIRSQKF